MGFDFKYGMTDVEYRAIEPTLTRPISLGGIRKRPRRDVVFEPGVIGEIQLKPRSAALQARLQREAQAVLKGQVPA